MKTPLSLFVIALVSGIAGAQSATNSLFISGNVLTGQTWHAATTAGNGSSGSCSTTSDVVEYYRAPFFTDTSASTYSLQ